MKQECRVSNQTFTTRKVMSTCHFSKGSCYCLNVCSPQNSYAEVLTPKVLIWGGGVFRRWWNQEGVACMDGIGTLTKEAPGSLLAPSAMWGHHERAPSRKQKVSPQQTQNLLEPCPWMTPLLELWETSLCCLGASQFMGLGCYGSQSRRRQIIKLPQ